MMDKLIITLKSDLCTGSGYSYSGTIDSDVCYDEYGIPYIPARRIKGCLREAAELIGIDEEKRNQIFGEKGQEGVKGICIENAYIRNYDEIRKELKTLSTYKKGDVSYRSYITPQNVLKQFTTVKSQTKIEANGVAKDTSLRKSRTINQYSPFGEKKELEFIANVTGEIENQSDWENAVHALRNMGLNRNRGLGSIRCELESVLGKGQKEQQDSSAENISTDIQVTGQESENKSSKQTHTDAEVPGQITTTTSDCESGLEYVLHYTIENVAPLMLSTTNDYQTERYINGQSVVGFFAGAYLRNHKDEQQCGNYEYGEFGELFLKNQVKYSPLYPCDETGMVYYPAPTYINSLKKSKMLVNMSIMSKVKLDDDSKDIIPWEYCMNEGNSPKSQRGKFIGRKNDEYAIKEVETDLIFHHPKEETENQKLYTLEAVRPGQYYFGTIFGKKEQLEQLRGYLTTERIRFGKSKSAQYGLCKLKDCQLKQVEEKEISYPADTSVLVVLQSDAIFVQEEEGQARYTVCFSEVKEQIRKALGIEEQNIKDVYSEIEVKELTGYYSKWNLKREALPVVAAGSAFEFVLQNEYKYKYFVEVSEKNPQTEYHLYHYVGERNGEGFGLVQIKQNGNKFEKELPSSAYEKYVLKPIDTQKNNDSSQKVEEIIKQNETKTLCQRILIAEALEKLKQDAVVKGEEVTKNKWTVSDAALGRATLMLKESVTESPKEKQKAYEAFWERINGIKKENAKNKLSNLIETCIGNKEKYGKFQYLETVTKFKLDKLYNALQLEQSFETELSSYWDEYLLTIFTQIKYMKKIKEMSGNKNKGGQNNG